MTDAIAYSSKLRKINPQTKTWFALCTLFLCVFMHDIYVSIIVIAFMWSVIFYGCKIRAHELFHLIAIPVLFLIMSMAAIILNISGTPEKLLALPFFGKYITCSKESVYKGISTIITAFSAVSCMYFYALTTPLNDMIAVMQKLKISDVITELFMLIYRFIFMLLDIAEDIFTAQKCRLSEKNIKIYLKSTAILCSVLFIRAFKRADILYTAMESRGYDGRINTLKKKFEKNFKITVFAVFFDLFLIALYIWRK
ncbi:MAG: cobalt ECF transporter T component CbiQ [Clostridia bacterium]|jgi:cobalt/nickel transport system permease protein|nr:cobalt ECF transporter T component CbiQ [Clostridia bacterium]MCI2000736.1 cobalt ECF transporter T component CbiQ [Clostridia bacterium]MCI2015191.1 cobalt ECF transporter T component CbiQ [Clostridia bacterium]